MSMPTEVKFDLVLTPEQLAEAFWGMGSDDQRRFYAHLYSVAGTKLCFQAACIVHEIIQEDDSAARDGFLTLHSHSLDYTRSAIKQRAWWAQLVLERMAKAATT